MSRGKAHDVDEKKVAYDLFIDISKVPDVYCEPSTYAFIIKKVFVFSKG